MKSPHIIIYSHGFGVRKDSRGMFAEIAAALPGYKSILFDYCTIDERANTATVPPIPTQAEKLRKIIVKTQQKYPGATIDLICHSQGCIVAGTAKPQGIRKIILLAPPTYVSAQQLAINLSRLSGKQITTQTFRIPRRDGSTTLLTEEYWKSLDGLDTQKLYANLSAAEGICIITANQDEVLSGPETAFEQLPAHTCAMGINGDHNFTGVARPVLIALIKKELG